MSTTRPAIRFAKAPATRRRFAALPDAVLARLGVETPTGGEPARGGPDEPAVALLSWLYWGARRGTPGRFTVRTRQGEFPVEVPVGHAAGSLPSVAEDALARTGARISRQQLRSAAGRLERLGLARDAGLVAPETRGRAGKLYDVRPVFAHANEPHTNPMDRVFQLDADPAEFTHPEVVRGHVTNRRNRHSEDGAAYLAGVAAGSAPADGLVSVGWWRPGQEFDVSSPVRVPLVYLDVDRQTADGEFDLDGALDGVRALLYNLEEWGADLSEVEVAFSGRRGFHVVVPTWMVGPSVFQDARTASEVVGRFSQRIASGPVAETLIDTCTFSAFQIVRATGAVHPKTGARKQAWRADAFLFVEAEVRAHVADALAGADVFTPSEPVRVDPPEGGGPVETFTVALTEAARSYVREGEEGLLDRAAAVRARATDRAGAPPKTPAGRVEGDGLRRSTMIRRIEEGVSEGERFHPRHSGRDKAAWFYSIWALRSGLSEPEALDRLEAVNSRFRPPLPSGTLRRALHSAKSYL